MGILINRMTGRRIFLRAEHVFGRRRIADTLLDHPDASHFHALVRWTGQNWELKDHSTNGTWLNGCRIPSDRAIVLNTGSVIEFGMHGGSVWGIESLAAPTTMLWPLHDDGAVIHLSSSNYLPDRTEPEILIYMTPAGQWVCVAGQRTRVLQDGDEVSIRGKNWCFVSGAAVQATLGLRPPPNLLLTETLLHFDVSLDEEHVFLKIITAHQIIDLGERAHHYCLLTLARKRLTDAQRHIDGEAQGWTDMDRLAKMLGVDASHLNIQIFRIRKQIGQSLPVNCVLPDVIERRRGAVRFGNLGLRIVRGSAVEGTLESNALGQAENEKLMVA